MNVCRKDLLKATSFADAKTILETVRASPAEYKLVEIAFANPNSREVLLNTVIQEENFMGNQAKDAIAGKHGSQQIDKKTQEEQLKTPRDSEGSSDSTEPYTGEGKDAPDGDIEGMQKASGENSMKEGFPMMGMGGMTGGMPPMAPDVMKQMSPQMPQMPQMNTPQMMRQMQYTVETYLRPILAKLGKMEEAIIAVDNKVKETLKGNQSIPLVIPDSKGNSWFKTNVQETIPDILQYATERNNLTPKSIALEQKRMSIADLDRSLSGNQPYN